MAVREKCGSVSDFDISDSCRRRRKFLELKDGLGDRNPGNGQTPASLRPQTLNPITHIPITINGAVTWRGYSSATPSSTKTITTRNIVAPTTMVISRGLYCVAAGVTRLSPGFPLSAFRLSLSV